MKKASLFIFLILSVFSIKLGFSQQELIGKWEGIIIQNTKKSFYFELRIEKINEDGTFTGTSYIRNVNSSDNYSKLGDYATMNLVGKTGKRYSYLSRERYS
ncbi:hypothetical protein [uncultured Psychroserpens sp.]|uniref:hypothetical protein n=1 Tax=uncultured Psychroserpens sp. TaxID=255436 RepID=UPI0026151DFE|nr:hypothetical protein [uncultured Psychroserpens sp.]